MVRTRIARFSLALGSLTAVAGHAEKSGVAVARSGGGQGVLAVGFDATGQILARVCAAAPCAPEGGTRLEVPAEAAQRFATARMTVTPIGSGRRAVVVEIPRAGERRAWAAVVAAPLAGDKPLTPFAGFTGPASGVDGERSGPALSVQPGALYVGTEREDLSLCGRPALLNPQALDPATLTLKPAKLQRLTEDERAKAPRIVAQPVAPATPATRSGAGGSVAPPPGPPAPPTAAAAPPPIAAASRPPSILGSVWATSAADGHSVAALTDGDAATYWAEDRGGVGRGEFAVLRAPREVPIAGFDVTVPAEAGRTRATTELWLATDHELFSVEIPDAKGKGGVYSVALPANVRTSCVAVVVEDAKTTDKDALVGVSELAARTGVTASVPELLAMLREGGERADAAAALLRAGGADAAVGLAAAFHDLDEASRRLALDVLDDAPCDVALPAYVEAFTGPYDAHRLHAKAALGRCGQAAAAALEKAVPGATGENRLALLAAISEISLALSVRAVVPLLATSSKEERRAYRALVAQAARDAEGERAIVLALESDATPERARLEVLRALAPSTVATDAASRAFARLSSSGRDFRTRFLLLEPAAALSERYPPAREFLREALARDKNAHVRAEAARVLVNKEALSAELLAAIDDRDVRVREAAALAIGSGRLNAASPRLLARLRDDPWPIVRAASARAITELRPSPEQDAALLDALTDGSPLVRGTAIGAVSRRGLVRSAPAIRDRLDDREEVDTVRAEAALALGFLCDRGSTDALTEYVRRISVPGAEISDHRIGQASVAALAALGPPDLEKRLSPLLGKEVPGPIQRLARAALRARPRCSSQPGKKP